MYQYWCMMTKDSCQCLEQPHGLLFALLQIHPRNLSALKDCHRWKELGLKDGSLCLKVDHLKQRLVGPGSPLEGAQMHRLRPPSSGSMEGCFHFTASCVIDPRVPPWHGGGAMPVTVTVTGCQRGLR